MRMLNTLLWQIAFILLLVYAGFDAFAWFAGGTVAMFWFIVVILAKEQQNEQR
jgi:hypothetical protein